jgi:hypothetical protein
MDKNDLFGFLPRKWILKFDGGTVSPLKNYEEVENLVLEQTNTDGFRYPPFSKTIILDQITMEELEEEPNTRRCAHLYHIPSSHEIILSNIEEDTKDFRMGPGGLIINLIAYLSGTRLQFEDWFVDGRIPIKRGNDIYITEKSAEIFISHSYKTWKGFDEKEKTWFINILYMLSRVTSYEWDWERFTIEYMVLDSCWKFLKHRNIVNGGTGHASRIEIICNKLGIPYDKQLIKEIVAIRNDLFHEALWNRSYPCFAVKISTYGQHYDYLMHNLNQRIIPKLIDFDTAYVHTEWWNRGVFPFD